MIPWSIGHTTEDYCIAMKNFEDMGIMLPFFMRGQLVDDSRAQHHIDINR